MTIPFLKDDTLPPGEVQQVAPGVRRVLCGNPGPFTFRGTNTWIIGEGLSVAVLDPGRRMPTTCVPSCAPRMGSASRISLSPTRIATIRRAWRRCARRRVPPASASART
jgi:hypothetical protein